MEYVLYEKKKSGLRNEALDLLTYNSILAKMQNPNWEKLKENMDKAVIASGAKQSVIPETTMKQSNNETIKINSVTQQKIIPRKIKQSNSITTW
jgi:phage terminase large subunit GpA-like protein